MAQPRIRRPLAAGLLGSVALHGAAGAMVAATLAWRVLPAPTGAEPALQVVWLPLTEVAPEIAAPAASVPGAATTEAAPLGPAMAEGIEPEDALATQVHALPPAVVPPAPASLPPLPMPEMDIAELPADPTALFAAPPPQQMASLSVLQPRPEAALPLPPPLPPRARAAMPAPSPAPAQPAALAAPTLPPPAPPAAIPVVTGAPRFRRPPAPPAYPDRMREAGIEGIALLRLRVAADGTTQEIRLLRSAGHRTLDDAAQAAARRWEIAPALRNGIAIEAWVDVPVRFRLDE
ncbi:energy transducer TonB [Dankookia rubra]|uniref:Energy transducer TonB n=1 Tax=Dankookia rubra TaxID=1442381 RepID=A0A4R5QF17_9PROT|nr:energy transducer TonB [Dankookia rubra]TDH61820.1 energy transducer TonB [Dankookia rubra]